MFNGYGICVLAVCSTGQPSGSLITFSVYGNVTVTIDAPAYSSSKKEKLIILHALPNGNSTEKTMGKKTAPGDDVGIHKKL